MKNPTQTYIGTFQLGHENVELWAFPKGDGGEFYFTPDNTSCGRIRIGLDYPDWNSVVAILLHEAFEYTMAHHSHRYEHSGKLMCDHADFLFVMNHPEFHQVCCCVGMFIVAALPELAKAYKNRNK